MECSEVFPWHAFGRLTVTRLDGKYAECLCVCGTSKIVLIRNLIKGSTTSCGCLHREIASRLRRTHGSTGSDTWKRWRSMINRCCMPNAKSYPEYGGRGIRICERWRDSLESFLEDMGECPGREMTLDRINFDGDYEPGNCRWATRTEQNRNSSRNRRISYKGENLCVSEWAERTGIKYRTILNRINLGWTAEEALETQVAQTCRNY